MRILLIEDDREVAHYVGRGLDEEGNTTTVCFDGADGLRAAQSSAFDVIVLDVMLPFMNGIEVIRRLRSHAVTTPILLLSARNTEQDIVRGLNAGADDYLTKPFSLDVLLARIRARTRSTHAPAGSKLRYSGISVDLETHEVWRGPTSLNLTPTEFAILVCLMKSGGRVVTRQRLIDTVWGSDREVGSNNLDVFIRFLRNKIDEPGRERLIQTIRGVGYCLRGAA